MPSGGHWRLKPVAFEFIVKGTLANTELFGGPTAIAIDGGQGPLNRSSLNVLECLQFRRLLGVITRVSGRRFYHLGSCAPHGSWVEIFGRHFSALADNS